MWFDAPADLLRHTGETADKGSGMIVELSDQSHIISIPVGGFQYLA